MAQNQRSAGVLACMIIATIYVLMLIGMTHSSYFVGGAALARPAQRYEVAAESRIVALPPRAPRHEIVPESRMVPEPVAGRAICVALEVKAEEPQECIRVTRKLNRLLGLRAD